MKSRLSLLVLVLIVSMLFSITACATNVSQTTTSTTVGSETQATSTESEKPVKIKFFRVAVEQDPNKDRTLIELQKRTNTELEFITAPWDQEVTKIMTMFSSNDQMDIVSLNDGGVNYPQMARDGLFIQLDELLATDKYPIEKKLAYGDIYFKKYNVDDKIYGIPCPIQPGDWNNIIRSDWLENVGLQMPKTPDDMYKVLKAFKEDDPDKNGKDDTLGVYVSYQSGQLSPLMNMFMFYGIPFDLIDNKIVFNYSSEKFKKGLEYIHKLYNEGLINSDFATIKDKDYVLNQMGACKSGMGNSPMIVRTLTQIHEIDPAAKIELLVPLPHDDGTNGANATDSKWNWMLNVLPSTCSNPAKCMEFLEFCNSEEGRILTCVGIEGIHYKSYKDGVFSGLSLDEQAKDWDLAKSEGPTGSPMWWGMTNTINGIIHYDKYDSIEDALKNVTTFVTEEDLASNPYWDMRKIGSNTVYHDPVPVSIDAYQEIVGEIGSLKAEFECKMIMSTSEAEFESLWSEYITRIDKAGVNDAVAAAQAWFDENS